MKNKRILIFFLKLFRLRNKKKTIPAKDSIRPMKTTTVFPPGWTKPREYTCQDGTIIPYGFTNLGGIRRIISDKIDKIPHSDAIDNSQ